MTNQEKRERQVRYKDRQMKHDLRCIDAAIDRLQGKNYREIARRFNVSDSTARSLTSTGICMAINRITGSSYYRETDEGKRLYKTVFPRDYELFE